MASAAQSVRWTPTCAPVADFMPGGGQLEVAADRPMTNAVLVLYYDHGLPWAVNVVEHAKSFSRHSRFHVCNVNTRFDFPPRLAEFDFAAIVLHYSMFGAAGGPLGPELGTPMYLLNEDHRAFLRTSKARKILVIQDEQSYGRARWHFCDEYGIDSVYTCLEPSEYAKTWRRYTKVPDVHTTLPGYVGDGMVETAERFAEHPTERSIDVGYRGRPIPIFVDTRQDKPGIARFGELAAGSGLNLDISAEEDARIYGDRWYRFLGDCRAMLGVESGASVFDAEDAVRNDYERLLAANGRVTLEELSEGPLKEWDEAIRYRTIGPRHFEAAAFRSCQVLFEGDYSGAIGPGEHYIELRRDFSNVEEVVEQLRDRETCAAIAERAYEKLIASGEYSYRAFVAGFDEDLIKAGLDPEIEPGTAKALEDAWRSGRRRRVLRWRFGPRLNRIRYAPGELIYRLVVSRIRGDRSSSS